jgi:hypothetical protein
MLAVLVVCASGTARADSPLAGKWMVTLLISGTSEVPVWLLQIDEKAGKFSARVLSAGLEEFDQAKFDKVQVEDNAIHARVVASGYVLYLSAYSAKDAPDAKVLRGSLLGAGRVWAIRLERTKLTKLDPTLEPKDGPGAKEMAKFKEAELQKDRINILKYVVKKYPADPVAIWANLSLMDAIADKATENELVGHADNALKVAQKYGPELESAVAQELAGIMLRSEQGRDLASGYGEESAKLLGKEVPASCREHTLKAFLYVLKEAKRSDQAKLVEKELAKLGPALDAEFKLVAIPFAFEPFKGRKGDSKRVAVVELFTGAQSVKCVAADAAFDALLETYKSKDVVLLQYHLHIPWPDPLTNADSEARMDFYNDNDKPGTPTIFVNGIIPTDLEKKKPVPIEFVGPKTAAKKGYDALRELLDKKLEQPAAADLALKAERDGNLVKLNAKVGKHPKNAKKLRLRFVVVEDVVRYAGLNQQRLHRHVVRGFAGSPKGVLLIPGTETYEQTLNLKKLKLRLMDYMAETHKNDPFPDNARPLDMNQLKVIAMIQRDDTKEILNAVQVDVPGN